MRIAQTRTRDLPGAVRTSVITNAILLARRISELQRRRQALIAQHTGQTVEQVERDSDRDRWFTAEEALEYGFIDHVVASAGQVADQARPAH